MLAHALPALSIPTETLPISPARLRLLPIELQFHAALAIWHALDTNSFFAALMVSLAVRVLSTACHLLAASK